jgi:hypothetical protein
MEGLHKTSKQYSVKKYIESDHTIFYDVWKSTNNKVMRKQIKGGGKRPGENELPAITILYNAHRNLLTTGSSKEAKIFRGKLVELCNQDRVDKALIKCFKDYAGNGINLKEYQTSINQSLADHVQLGLIDAQQKKNIISELYKTNRK